ncbi:MAG: hypothetical protein J7507_12005 [Pseudoxanthomonas sp.]|nr:hypothetical protein [Pseudoxanthomonas sp.]
MFHGKSVENTGLKVETVETNGVARLPVEGLKKYLPVRGYFQPNRPAAVEGLKEVGPFQPDAVEHSLPESWGVMTVTQRNRWLHANGYPFIHFKARTGKFYAAASCPVIGRSVYTTGIDTLAEAVEAQRLLAAIIEAGTACCEARP